MDELEWIHARLDCLRLAVEHGTQRDVINPHQLADLYWEWVVRGSDKGRPEGSRKDGRRKQSQNARSVRKGSAADVITMPTE
jgi:hypothetical protein